MCYLIVLVLFLVGFFVLSWRRLDWAAMLIIAGLPLYLVRFKVAGVPTTLLEAMILIAFFCWLIFQTHLKDFLSGKYKIKDFIKNSPWQKDGSAAGRIKYPFGIEIVLMLVISFIAVGVAHFSAGALGIWKAYFFEPSLLYVLILNVLGYSPAVSSTTINTLKPATWFKRFLVAGVSRNDKGVYKIGLSLAVGAFAISVYAVFQKLTGFGIANPLWAAEATRRVVSFFGYPNAVGLYLAPLIPVLIAFLFFPKKECGLLPEKYCFPLKKENISAIGLSRGFLGFIILLSLLAVYFAKSDGALIGLAAAAFFICLLANKKARLVAIIIVAIVSIGIYFYPPIEKPLMRKVTAMDLSGQVRRYQWKETLVMLNHDRFFQGAGLDNYQSAVAPYHQEGFFYDNGTDPDFHKHTVESAEYRAKTWQPVEVYMYPHDIFLNFWSEIGLAGMLLFVWIMIKFLIINLQLSIKDKKNKYLYLGLFGAMVVIVVHGLVDVPYFKNDLSCLFWILFAILALLKLKLTTGEKSIK